VAEVIDEAARRFGPSFTAIADSSRLWVNGVAAGRDQALTGLDEVAVLPPVSGG
jgi:molybdopterin converting factor small subunit